MGEKDHTEPGDAPELKQPEESIQDLEPDEAESAAVKGGEKLGVDHITG